MLSGTWNKDNPALCRYMASLGHNVFNLVHFTNTYSNKNDRCWFLLLNIAACLLKRLQCGDQPKILYYIFTLLNTGSNLEKKLRYGNTFLPTLAWCQTWYATRKTIITFLVKHIRITNDLYIPYTKSCCIYTMLTFLQWDFSTTETIVTLLVNMWIWSCVLIQTLFVSTTVHSRVTISPTPLNFMLVHIMPERGCSSVHEWVPKADAVLQMPTRALIQYNDVILLV